MTKQLWKDYYQKMAKSPHHPMIEYAIAHHYGSTQVAIDCGCGTGRNLHYLHNLGYQVYGFDINFDAIELCRQDLKSDTLNLVQLSVCSFEQYNYPLAGIIVANNSLFFAEPNQFTQTWQNMTAALEIGGIFVGDFMGMKDDWLLKSQHTISAFSREQVEALFINFEIIKFSERDERGQTALGKQKHWHTFSVIARKTSN